MNRRVNPALRLLMFLFVLIILFVYCYPLLYIAGTSLKTQSEYMLDPVGLPKSFHLENFPEAWTRANLGTQLGNSLFYTFVCTFLSVGMAIFLSYPIARNYVKLSNVIYIAFMIGIFLPDGSIPRWRMIFNAGLFDTRTGYILTLIGAGGVMLMMFVSYIKSLPTDLDEAAMIDGCGYIPFIFRILIPLMKPAITSMALLSAITVWNDIMNSILYLSSEELYPITRGLYVFKGRFITEWPLLTAGLLIVAAPMLIMYIFLQKNIVDGIVAGGVKM